VVLLTSMFSENEIVFEVYQWPSTYLTCTYSVEDVGVSDEVKLREVTMFKTLPGVFSFAFGYTKEAHKNNLTLWKNMLESDS